MTRFFAALSLVALLASPAAAYRATAVDAQPEGPLHSVSVTLSPLHLVLPVLELQGEFAVGPQMGVSLILGYGSVSVSDGFTTEAFSVFEIGGQFAYYALGDFDHGLQIGAEVLYLGVSADADSQFGGVFGRGLSLAPFVGYKVAADFGLTFQAQVGPAFFVVSAESGTESEEQAAIGVMLNLNLGWSF
ncbi:MAG: hypothetical protein CVU56_12375 [Deltaproteobacteria bacterium HGW-Deltaproteobacteria-14]|jgi:hypothetical protein|nr:MAG: hypothetical protein CVU56_12375 [Deltaproteobacteria bacterium HGW-Deltaproteobacteria-14]